MEVNKVNFDTSNPYRYQSRVQKKSSIDDNVKLSPVSKGLNLIVKNGLAGEECSEANIIRGKKVIENWTKPSDNKVDSIFKNMLSEF